MELEWSKDILFEQLYNEYNKRILNYMYMNIKDQWLAEDLTSEVFLKVYRNKDKINDVARSGKWLMIIAKNTIIDYYRKGTRELPVEELASEGIFECGYDNVFIKDEFKSVKGLIEELPDDSKKMIVMRYYYGYKFKEIAASMDLTENAVKCRVSRVMKKLKRISAAA